MSLVCFLAWRESCYFYVKTTCTTVTVSPAFSCLTAWASLLIYTRHLWSSTYYLGRIRSPRVHFYNNSVACLYLITESPKIRVPYLRKNIVWNRCNRALQGQISYFLALPCSENLKISVRHFYIFGLNYFLPFQILFCVLAAMAMYSDLLFAVSGDPIDVRASIYKNIATNILFLKVTQGKFCHWYYIKRIKFFWPSQL